MGVYEDRAKLLWTFSAANSTTIGASGNSGGWAIPSPDNSDMYSAVPLGPGSDFQLTVFCGGKTLSPTLTVGLGYFDSAGHLFNPTALQVTVTLTSTPATAVLNAGVRAGGGGTSYFAFPEWGQVYWIYGGTGTVTGVEMNLWGK